MDPRTEIKLNQVDGKLCTHIVLAFARVDSLGNLTLAREGDVTYLLEVREFKRRFPGVKVMISVYNAPDQNSGLVRAANVVEYRQRFSRSVIEFLQRFYLDGIDLDWEFSSFASPFVAREHERIGLIKLMQTLRTSMVENFFDRQVNEQHQHPATQNYINTNQTNQNNLVEPHLLTVAVAGQDTVFKSGYELKQAANLCDWLNVMCYDYFHFKAYAPFTGPNSPLQPIVDSYVPILSRLSVSWTLSRLLEEQIPNDKIVLGIPTYARAYKLMFKNTQPAPFSLAIGIKGGQRSEEHLDYREICDILKRPDTVVEFDARARVPYLLTDEGYTWISYESPQSVREKVRFVLQNNLAGYMTWDLNSDDFTGQTATAAANGTSPGDPMDGQSQSSATCPAAFPLHRAMLDEVGQFCQ